MSANLTGKGKAELKNHQHQAKESAKLAKLAKLANADIQPSNETQADKIANTVSQANQPKINAKANPEILAEREKNQESASIKIVEPNYTLTAEFSGMLKFNEKWNQDSARITAEVNLLNRDKVRLNEHVLLNIGSEFSYLTACKVTMVKDNFKSFILAEYTRSTNTWKVISGINADKTDIDTSKIEAFESSQAKVKSGRFHARLIIGKLLPYLASEFEKETTLTQASRSPELIANRLQACELRIRELAIKILKAKASGKPYEKFAESLAKAKASKAELESALSKAKANETQAESGISEVGV